MIAHLRGEPVLTGDRWVVIDVGGIGYQVQVTQPVLHQLAQTKEPVKLFTHMAVREDAIERNDLGILRGRKQNNDRNDSGRREEALAVVQQLGQAKVLVPFHSQRITKDSRIVDIVLTATALVNESGEA